MAAAGFCLHGVAHSALRPSEKRFSDGSNAVLPADADAVFAEQALQLLEKFGAGFDLPLVLQVDFARRAAVAVAQAQGDAAAGFAGGFEQGGEGGDVGLGSGGEGEAAGEFFARLRQGHDAVGADAQLAAVVVAVADAAFGDEDLVGFEPLARFFEQFARNAHFGKAAAVFELDDGEAAAFAVHGAYAGGEAGHAHAVLRFQTA